MSASSSYDATVALDRKLTVEEMNELKIIMMPCFQTTSTNTTEDDIVDLIDYAIAMINNQKSIEFTTTELIGMEMEFCTSAIADQVGNALSEFVQNIVAGGSSDVTAAAAAAAAPTEEEEEAAGGEDESSKKNPKIASLKVRFKKK